MEETREKLIKIEKRRFWKLLVMIIIYSIVIASLFVFLDKRIVSTQNDNKIKVEAIVKERVDNYLLLEYEVSGEKINAIQETLNDNVKIGDKYSVLCIKNNPNIISKEEAVILEVNKDSTGSILMFMLTIMIGAIIVLYVKIQRRVQVLKEGIHIKASYYSNNFGMLQFKWKDEKENKLYYFNVYPPRKKIKENSLHDIYMDKNNPKKFMILFDNKKEGKK